MTDREYFEKAIRAAVERKTLMHHNLPAYGGDRPVDIDWEPNQISVRNGYDGFVAQIDFNEDGSLKDISAWE